MNVDLKHKYHATILPPFYFSFYINLKQATEQNFRPFPVLYFPTFEWQTEHSSDIFILGSCIILGENSPVRWIDTWVPLLVYFVIILGTSPNVRYVFPPCFYFTYFCYLYSLCLNLRPVSLRILSNVAFY